MVKGLHMLQKLKYTNGSLTADQLFFAKFLENHIQRMMNNLLAYNLSGFDSKMASNLLIAFTDYYRLLYGTTDYGTYTPVLPANSNTTATYDDRPSQSTLYAQIDVLLNSITAKQLHTSDWRNGIFVDDATAGNWYAWGELQIYALSNVYAMKRSIGQTPAQLSGLLDTITYSADNFYGLEAYHYIDGVNNFSRTKERITQIVGLERAVPYELRAIRLPKFLDRRRAQAACRSLLPVGAVGRGGQADAVSRVCEMSGDLVHRQ